MLVHPNGTPLGMQEGKKIVISENFVQGKPVWGVEFHPSIQAFEFEEVFQILGEVTRGIAQNARARKQEAIKLKEVHKKMASIDEKEKEK